MYKKNIEIRVISLSLRDTKILSWEKTNVTKTPAFFKVFLHHITSTTDKK